VLQCVAVSYSVLQCVAVCCSVLQYVAACCSVLQCRAVCYYALHRGVKRGNTATPTVAVCCSVLQYAAVCCSVLQCVAVCVAVFSKVCKEVTQLLQLMSAVYLHHHYVSLHRWSRFYLHHLPEGNRGSHCACAMAARSVRALQYSPLFPSCP